MGVVHIFGTTVPFSPQTSQTVGPVGQVVIVLLCLGIGGLIALVGAGYLQTYTRVRKIDPVDIQRLTDTDGEVELSGTARPHEETSRSPFTDTECLAHEWEAKRYRGGGRGPDWSTLDSGATRHPFRLDDGTGTVLIDPNGATLELLTEETIEVEPSESPPPAVSAYLDQTDSIEHEQTRTRRYTEQRLERGDDVHVLGPVRRLAHSVDMPGDADAIIGVSNPDRGFTVGEDGLSELVDQIKTDTMRFVITSGDERKAERHLLKKGLFISGFGIVFALIPLLLVLLL